MPAHYDVYHRCRRCGHGFIKRILAAGDFDDDGDRKVTTCEVCTSEPYKKLKREVRELRKQIATR